MKLMYEDDKLVLYLNKMYIHSLDFSDKEMVQKYMKRLFLKVSNRYDIEFDGYYVVKLYVDMNYGVIIEVVKEELEYLDYFSNQIEMNTEVIHGSFLYEPFDVSEQNLDCFVLYKFNDKLYMGVKSQISDMQMGNLLEHSRIIYGIEADNIIKKGKIVR